MSTLDNASRPSTAIVIGDGVIGLSTAIALRRQGIATRLIAPDIPWRGASWGNAGHIAVEQIEPLASLATLGAMPGRLFARGGPVALPLSGIGAWLPFAMRLVRASTPARFARGTAALRQALATAVPAWQRLLADAGDTSLLRLDGHFIVWEHQASAARGMARWCNADLGTASAREATPAERAQVQALTTAPLAGAVRIEGSGQMTDTGALGALLRQDFAARGGECIDARVVHLAAAGAGGQARLDTGETKTADLIVVAAGAESRHLLAPLGIRAPLIAERGYHIETPNTDWPASMPPVVFEDRAMIVTRFRSALRAASFVEFARHDHPADLRKWQRLQRNVAELGLSLETPISTWIGARPTLPDYLPAIGRDRSRRWLAYAFGHQHLGLTLGATTGDALAAAIVGETPAFALVPFSLDRFAR